MLERKGKRVWKKEDYFTQRTFGTSLVAQGLEFWSFTIMAQVPSLVGKQILQATRYNQNKTKNLYKEDP